MKNHTFLKKIIEDSETKIQNFNSYKLLDNAFFRVFIAYFFLRMFSEYKCFKKYFCLLTFQLNYNAKVVFEYHY